MCIEYIAIEGNGLALRTDDDNEIEYYTRFFRDKSVILEPGIHDVTPVVMKESGRRYVVDVLADGTGAFKEEIRGTEGEFEVLRNKSIANGSPMVAITSSTTDNRNARVHAILLHTTKY